MLPLGLKIRKLIKTLGLRALILGKPLLPKSFIVNTLFRLTNVKLEFEDVKNQTEITICKYKYGAKGALCVSIDFDLPLSQKPRTDWREATTKILQLAEKYSISMSWGICGALALNEPQIFDQIKNSAAPLDLGVHTFTHADFSDPHCTKETAKDEILKCKEVLKDIKEPVTFIFPWNRIGHLSTLKDCGFIAYRGNKNARLAYPSKSQQLWNIHGTYYLVERSVEEVVAILRLLDSAVSYGCVLHLWSHPWDMHINGNVGRFMERVLDPVFRYAMKKEEEGPLWVCTMRQLANYCEARESCRISDIAIRKEKISFSVSCKIEDQRFDFPPSTTLRIPVPTGWKKIRVLVDGVEQSFGLSCIMTRQRLKSYLMLTLSFGKPTCEVSLVRADRRKR